MGCLGGAVEDEDGGCVSAVGASGRMDRESYVVEGYWVVDAAPCKGYYTLMHSSRSIWAPV